MACLGKNHSASMPRAVAFVFSTALYALAAPDIAYADDISTSVATGAQHACKVTVDGGVKCWGSNGAGQIGDGSGTDQLSPVTVSGLASGAVSVAAGGNFSCALTTAGAVKCWGENTNGQLGNGTTTNQPTPVDVTGLSSGIIAIAAGASHACALATGGGVKCWGANSLGQLGDSTNTQSLTPVDVVVAPATPLTGVAAIAAGWTHTCAITQAGVAKCWGDNNAGQVGDGTSTNRSVATDVSALASVAAIAAGRFHTCAVTSAGAAECWGGNGSGQLGDGTTSAHALPANVASLASGVMAISAGDGHSCAITTTGGAKCWGANAGGQLGDGTNVDETTPVDVAGFTSGIAAISASTSSTCALMAQGWVRCWGLNASGQLGDGSSTARNAPDTVIRPAVAIAAGTTESCMITILGKVECWGDYAIGSTTTPTEVPGLSDIVAVSSGDGHTCALSKDGHVKCWGNNGFGQVGTGTAGATVTTPTDVGLVGARAIAAGGWHTCALTSTGGVKCWGWNFYGEVGDGTNTQRASPVDVSGLSSGIAGIAAGNIHSCALTSDHVVLCWGDNLDAQLSEAVPSSPSYTPVVVDSYDFSTGAGTLSNAVSISATGGWHTCALLTTGSADCWGDDPDGRTGQQAVTNNLWQSGSLTIRAVALQSGNYHPQSVVAGSYHSCAIISGGGVQCWGPLDYGLLGNGANVSGASTYAAQDVTGLTGAVALAASGYHTCALLDSGQIKCWGRNQYGELGNGTTSLSAVPVDVAMPVGQTISFAAPAPVAFGGTVALSAVASSGLPVIYDTWTPATCTVSGNTLTAVGIGFCGVRASQPGDSAHFPAAPQLRLVTIAQATQAITFDMALPTHIIGDVFTVSAAGGGSGNPVTFAAIPDSSVCSTSGTNGTTVTAIAVGTCTIRASQAGNADYLDAPSVDRSFAVVPPSVSVTVSLQGDGSGTISGPGISCPGQCTAQVPVGAMQLTASANPGSWMTQWGTPTGPNGLLVGCVGNVCTVTLSQDMTIYATFRSNPGALRIAAGEFHTCVVPNGNSPQCWGRNDVGQLGDGTTTDRSLPFPLVGNGTNIDALSIAVGDKYACTTPRGIGVPLCWGDNSRGQFGNSSTQTALNYTSGPPVQMLSMGAGSAHMCAVALASGVRTVQCWGSNGNGQLGDGTTTDRLSPVIVAGLGGDPVAVAAADDHSCALLADGTVQCWGRNSSGQLGNGSTSDSAIPLTVSGVSGASAVFAAPERSCALIAGGGLKCWGANDHGQLGDNTTTPRLTPTDVAGSGGAGLLSNVVDFAGGLHHSCAAFSDGSVACWGGDSVGQLGDGSTTDRYSAAAISGLSGITSITSRGDHTCATNTNSVWCWGSNAYGQLGDGTTVDRHSPAIVTALQTPAGKSTQTITFNPPSQAVKGTSLTLTATTTSGLGVTFSAEGVCGVQTIFHPPKLSFGNAGLCVVTASAGGNATFLPALPVTRYITVVLPSFTLTVATSGTGTGTVTGTGIACPGDCSETVTSGTGILLTATADANSTFAGWSGGGCTGTGTCNVSVTADTTVTATFSRIDPAHVDFNGDAHPDLVWSNIASGATYAWYMGGTPPALISDAFIAQIDPSWQVQGIADFNGDGHPDLVWRNTANGNCYVWYMNGVTFITDAFLFSLPPQWVIQGLGDFNADGKPDFFMRNTDPASGVGFVWYFNDATAIGSDFLFGIDPTWKVVAVADFNGDGQPDLLFRNVDPASGLAFVWNTQFTGGVTSLAGSTPPIFSIDPTWEVAQVADWNADGIPDLVFWNSASGVVFVWYLNSGNVLGGSDFIIQIDPSWQIVPRR